MAKKRERLEVINDILGAIRDARELGPTRLLYSSNLSPQMFKEYTEELLSKKFIEELDKKGRKKYALTNKGYKFLEEYRNIQRFIEDFGL